MKDLSADLEKSGLWRTTLAPRNSDEHTAERARLRNAFLRFREHAARLASEIRRDLPSLTIHDETHLDALWDVASIIVGEDYSLTPTEGFVLGGAILLHDLAMSVAATPGGLEAIIKDLRWADIVTSKYRAVFERDPTSEELGEPEQQIFSSALFEILRQIHAENAEKLAFISYRTSDGSAMFLIEDTEVRQTFGQVLGRIAHSHWWSLSEVERQFSRVLGPPSWCPRGWTVDPLKIACILRTADAAHLDARRAPTLLRAITHLSSSSEVHWGFQEKLAKPYLRHDSLVFTSSRPFQLNDAVSWWLCLETLRMVDRELRGVDAMFADRGYPRYAARHVAGVDNPERLSSYVQTDGWLPINAMVHVTDLPQVIRNLGGEALYGRQPRVPLRELIQNACDAVRARRAFEGRAPNFGSITVALIEQIEEQEYWLEVADSGVGMSQRVLTEFLLDFGTSFWGSPQMQEEFPGLLATNFRPTGKYGVGFFSVFMIANQIQVFTRRADAAAADTLVLEFSSGLQGRPILRRADRSERLIDGGTRIRLKLKTNPRITGGILRHDEPEASLESLLQEIAPALDVDLFVTERGSTVRAVGAGDWKSINGSDLLARVKGISEDQTEKEVISEVRDRAAANLRLLQDDNGTIFGRACISIGYARFFHGRYDVSGAVCVGGLQASGLTGIAGLLIGEPVRAARDAARPTVPDKVLRKWAEDQTDLIPNLWSEPEDQAGCAQYVRMCGGQTRNLPIAKNRGSWVSAKQIEMIGTQLDTVVILDNLTVKYELGLLESLTLHDNVFVTHASGVPGLLHSASRVSWPRDLDTNFAHGSGSTEVTLAGAIIDAISKAWDVRPSDILPPRSLNRESKVNVGTDGEREICVRAIIIKKPTD